MQQHNNQRSFISVFDQLFDVAIYGAGHAGYIAAMQLADQGLHVLLIDTCGDLVWESGRCFVPTVGEIKNSDTPHLQKLLDDVAQRGGYDGTFLDGGMAEVSATCFLKQSDVRALYYVYPVAVEKSDDLIKSIILATKSGLRRVVARQFIDASENGLLHRLTGDDTPLRQPSQQHLYMYLQHLNWPDDAGGTQTIWETQRLFVGNIAQDQTIRQATQQTISQLNASEKQGVLSHVSVDPYPVYEHTPRACQPHGNLASASPAFAGDAIYTLADRAKLGMNAVTQIKQMPCAQIATHDLHAQIPSIKPVAEIQTDVMVAGVGTGGALAAIAAGMKNMHVTAIDPMTFPGGIGTGGGIHAYYFDVPGGLQDTIDQQTSALMKEHDQVLKSHRFNPVAKMIVLENQFTEHHVQFIPRSMLCNVTVQHGSITSALIATKNGPVRIIAQAYIDGTGDGDLCAMAGADFYIGREADGLPHALSQSSGYIHIREHYIASAASNYDSGWCDPTDPDDLTRARMLGIAQLIQDKATNAERVTYITPALGLRQARQIQTDYVVTLDDQLSGKQFNDVIGYSGCDYDSHTVDYPLEADEGMFWVCLMRMRYTPYVFQIPYRCQIPVGLKNVLIASRSLGVTQDAHYALRMMRAMQRIGESAGYAAAQLVQQDIDNLRDIDINTLQSQLKQTGALLDDPSETCKGWHRKLLIDMQSRQANLPIEKDPRTTQAIKHLKEGREDAGFWLLMKNQSCFEKQVLKILMQSDNVQARWYAAGIAAMWGCQDAEPVLIDAIKQHRYGYESRTAVDLPRDQQHPIISSRYYPDWLTAVCLLRKCGTNQCLDVLLELLTCHIPTLLTAESVLYTIRRLIRDKRITDFSKVIQIIQEIRPEKITQQNITAQVSVSGLADIALNGWDEKSTPTCAIPHRWPIANTVEDHQWQLELMLAHICQDIDMNFTFDLLRHTDTDRTLVRNILAQVHDCNHK